MKYDVVACRLKDLLNMRRLTAQELSDRSGISKSSISGYVNGTHCPTNKAAVSIASVLGVSPEYIMGFDVPEDRRHSKEAHEEVLALASRYYDLLISIERLDPDKQKALSSYLGYLMNMQKKDL